MASSCQFNPIVLPTRAIVLLLSLPLALGCGGERSPPSLAADAPGLSLIGEACSVAFSPVEALRLDVEEAAVRWSVATSCDVFVASGGIPVVLAPSILRPDGSESPGATSIERDFVRINAQSSYRQRRETVMHELGHALGGDHTAGLGVLSGEKGHGDVIDEAALETVCSRLHCGVLSPEAP